MLCSLQVLVSPELSCLGQGAICLHEIESLGIPLLKDYLKLWGVKDVGWICGWNLTSLGFHLWGWWLGIHLLLNHFFSSFLFSDWVFIYHHHSIHFHDSGDYLMATYGSYFSFFNFKPLLGNASFIIPRKLFHANKCALNLPVTWSWLRVFFFFLGKRR